MLGIRIEVVADRCCIGGIVGRVEMMVSQAKLSLYGDSPEAEVARGTRRKKVRAAGSIDDSEDEQRPGIGHSLA